MDKKFKISTKCNKTELMNRMLDNYGRFSHNLNLRMKNDFSISLAKYDVLKVIDQSEKGKITMSDLSRELMVSNANMTGMTTRLERDGLIDKSALSTDRRVFNIVLTEQGKDILQKATLSYQEWVDQLLSTVSEKEVDFLNDFFDKMDCQLKKTIENF